MAKPKMYGMNKKYVPNYRADRKKNNLFKNKKGSQNEKNRNS